MQRVPLWRICRVLANRPRLKLFGLLIRRPGLRVSDLARATKLSRPAASQYLRALEACGLVVARRIHRSVVYELSGRNADATARALIRPLMIRLGTDKTSIESTFKLATTFANPGRIDVFRRLSTGPKPLAELKAATGCGGRTLRRHLAKLETRGFVCRAPNVKMYQSVRPLDEFARALAHAAVT